MFAGVRTRRELDKQQRRAAANREIGKQLAWTYFWGPKLTTAAVLMAVAYGCWFLWTRVDHERIAAVVGALGVTMLVAFGVWLLTAGSPHARVMRRARGETDRQIVMPLVGTAGALFLAAAVALWWSQT